MVIIFSNVFQDTEDSDGEPIVYQSFDVGPDFDGVTTGDIRPMGFVVQGELRVTLRENLLKVTLHCISDLLIDGVIDEDFGEVGRMFITIAYQDQGRIIIGSLYVCKSGYLASKCLFGNIAGETATWENN